MRYRPGETTRARRSAATQSRDRRNRRSDEVDVVARAVIVELGKLHRQVRDSLPQSGFARFTHAR